MSFLWMTLIGLMAGALAKLLMPEKDMRSLLILGIGGSLIAGGILYADRQAIGFVAPVCGAVALLAIYRGTAVKPATPAAFRGTAVKSAAPAAFRGTAVKSATPAAQKAVQEEEDFRRAA
jgi:uncharacterized membrane protein YeaQ/YmgE (transglycosylase-associated protein family)